MSRIYVDRISPYQSGSLTIDGFSPTVDTGSLATTGSNTFNGNQVITGSLTSTEKIEFTMPALPSEPFINNRIFSISGSQAFYGEPVDQFFSVDTTSLGSTRFNISSYSSGSFAYGGRITSEPSLHEMILMPSGSDYQARFRVGTSNTTGSVAFVHAQFVNIGTLGGVNRTDDINIGNGSVGNINLTSQNLTTNVADYNLTSTGGINISAQGGSIQLNGDVGFNNDAFLNNIQVDGESTFNNTTNFNGNQVITGSVDAQGTVFDNLDFSVGGLQTKTNYTNVVGRNGETFSTTFFGTANIGNTGIDGLISLYNNGSYFSSLSHGPNNFRVAIRPSGSADTALLRLTDEGDLSTLLLMEATKTQVTSELELTGSIDITETLKLTAQDPLPAGELGRLAVSGSDLYFHDGTDWIQK